MKTLPSLVLVGLATERASSISGSAGQDCPFTAEHLTACGRDTETVNSVSVWRQLVCNLFCLISIYLRLPLRQSVIDPRIFPGMSQEIAVVAAQMLSRNKQTNTYCRKEFLPQIDMRQIVAFIAGQIFFYPLEFPHLEPR
ncbi:MAG: hypothetical protein ACXWFF_00605 [Methylomonas sp.]